MFELLLTYLNAKLLTLSNNYTLIPNRLVSKVRDWKIFCIKWRNNGKKKLYTRI